MHEPRFIRLGLGVNGFRLGMTRPELWRLTNSNVLSFLRGDAAEREDDLQADGITVAYEDGVARSFTVFARVPSRRLAPIIVLEEDVAAYRREDVVALLELHALAREDGHQDIAVRSLGLTFWFRQDAGEAAAPAEALLLPPAVMPGSTSAEHVARLRKLDERRAM